MRGFVQDLSLGNFRLGCFAWELRLGSPDLEFSFDIFCLGSFAWELSLENVRLVTLVWDPSFGNFSFGTLASEL